MTTFLHKIWPPVMIAVGWSLTATWYCPFWIRTGLHNSDVRVLTTGRGTVMPRLRLVQEGRSQRAAFVIWSLRQQKPSSVSAFRPRAFRSRTKLIRRLASASCVSRADPMRLGRWRSVAIPRAAAARVCRHPYPHPAYWAHHRVLSQGKPYSRPRRYQYPSSPKEYCAEAMPVPKKDAPANTINASFVILASHER